MKTKIDLSTANNFPRVDLIKVHFGIIIKKSVRVTTFKIVPTGLTKLGLVQTNMNEFELSRHTLGTA